LQYGILHGGIAGSVKYLHPSVSHWGQLADTQDRQIDQQLGEIKLEIDLVAAAGTGQTVKDRGGSPPARVAYAERVLQNWLHLARKKAGPKIAAIFAIVESCRKLGVPIRQYLANVLPGLSAFG